MKCVSLPRGASPPGRTPRRTSTVGQATLVASVVRVAPRPSLRQRSVRPTHTTPAFEAAAMRASALGSTRTGSAGTPRACWTASGAGQQPAGVAALLVSGHAGQSQRSTGAARQPRAELDGCPIVGGSAERHQYHVPLGPWPGAGPTATATSHGACSSRASTRASSRSHRGHRSPAGRPRAQPRLGPRPHRASGT